MTIASFNWPKTVGLKAIENVHVPAAGKVAPQVFVTEKSDAFEIEEIVNGELPMFPIRTVEG
jgi:hypothetical protein